MSRGAQSAGGIRRIASWGEFEILDSRPAPAGWFAVYRDECGEVLYPVAEFATVRELDPAADPAELVRDMAMVPSPDSAELIPADERDNFTGLRCHAAGLELIPNWARGDLDSPERQTATPGAWQHAGRVAAFAMLDAQIAVVHDVACRMNDAHALAHEEHARLCIAIKRIGDLRAVLT